MIWLLWVCCCLVFGLLGFNLLSLVCFRCLCIVSGWFLVWYCRLPVFVRLWDYFWFLSVFRFAACLSAYSRLGFLGFAF